jgi:hypothetical protein
MGSLFRTSSRTGWGAPPRASRFLFGAREVDGGVFQRTRFGLLGGQGAFTPARSEGLRKLDRC